MLEILKFIFSDAWHFLGTLILLEAIFPIVKIERKTFKESEK